MREVQHLVIVFVVEIDLMRSSIKTVRTVWRQETTIGVARQSVAGSAIDRWFLVNVPLVSGAHTKYFDSLWTCYKKSRGVRSSADTDF